MIQHRRDRITRQFIYRLSVQDTCLMALRRQRLTLTSGESHFFSCGDLQSSALAVCLSYTRRSPWRDTYVLHGSDTESLEPFSSIRRSEDWREHERGICA